MPEPIPKTVIVYETVDGKRPFADWINMFRDNRLKARINNRISRLSLGLYGDWKRLSNAQGISELRLDFGSGYRVYFAEYDDAIVILLCAGDKRSQRNDIEQAMNYWRDFRSRQDD